MILFSKGYFPDTSYLYEQKNPFQYSMTGWRTCFFVLHLLQLYIMHAYYFYRFYIYTCNAHTFLMTARNKTAMFQNLRTVSDIVNSVTQLQQRGTGLSIADSLLNTRGEVHKDSIFHCMGELPKREVVRELE